MSAADPLSTPYALWPYLATIAVLCALVVGASWLVHRALLKRERSRGAR